MLQKEGLWIRNHMHSLATCVHRFHMIPKEVSQGYACQGFVFFWGGGLVLVLSACITNFIPLSFNLHLSFLHHAHLQSAAEIFLLE